MHADSELAKTVEQAGPGVHVVKFGGGTADHDRNRASLRAFLSGVKEKRREARPKRSFLTPQDAAEGHAALFNRVVESRLK